MIVTYRPFEQVILFGGTTLISKLAKRLKDKFTVSVYTAPRQAADVECIDGVMRVVTPDINEVLEPFEVGDALGIGLGEAWRFGPKLREAFGDRLVDFMSIPYPSYLGGAHTSHAIMRGERHWGMCMQLLTENTEQGVVHDGAVLFNRHTSFPLDDEHHQLEREYLDFILDFVAKAYAGYGFKPVTENSSHNPKFYYPRLNTERQGWVNWSWRRHEVVRFIRAFDAPYPGARTMVHDGRQSRLVTVHEAIDFGVSDNHPFQAGLITDIVRTIRDTRATVALRGGPVAVTVRDDIGKDPLWLQPGMRLYTDQQTLDRAMTYCPQYTSVGDVGMKDRT